MIQTLKCNQNWVCFKFSRTHNWLSFGESNTTLLPIFKDLYDCNVGGWETFTHILVPWIFNGLSNDLLPFYNTSPLQFMKFASGNQSQVFKIPCNNVWLILVNYVVRYQHWDFQKKHDSIIDILTLGNTIRALSIHIQ